MATAADETIPREIWVPRAKRTVTTLLLARMQIAGAGDHLCRIRNVSEGGALVEAEVPLEKGDRLKLELRSGEVLAGTVVWIGPGRAGMRFDEGIDVQEVLATPMIARPGIERQPRAPRFAGSCPALLRSAKGTLSGTLVNISQSGALMRMGDAPVPDGLLALALPGLEPRACMLRWHRDGETGVAFAKPLAFRELASWLARPELRFGRH